MNVENGADMQMQREGSGERTAAMTPGSFADTMVRCIHTVFILFPYYLPNVYEVFACNPLLFHSLSFY